ANIFAGMSFSTSPEAKKVIDAENAERKKLGKKNNQVNTVKEVFISKNRSKALPHPDTNAPLTPKALGGPEIQVPAGEDARVPLFNWMRSPDNPFFARSFVNRVWGHYFEKGLVHPLDDFSLANPPSNDKLLDALAKDFIDHKFNIRELERTILN